MSLEDEIQALCQTFDGLDYTVSSKLTNISGVISFNAHYEGLESIEDWFEVEIVVPEEYPTLLPIVSELQGKIHNNYEHLYPNSTFCLATPLAERQAFNQEPTLLGFVNNLVIPYLYSYCFLKKYGYYPFEDRSHGLDGIVEHYLDIFDTDAKPELFEGLFRIEKNGYRGHLPCPCGSGNIVRKCHKDVVMDIANTDTRRALSSELKLIRAALGQLAEADKKRQK